MAVWMPFNGVCTAPGLSVTLYSCEGNRDVQVSMCVFMRCCSWSCGSHFECEIASYVHVYEWPYVLPILSTSGPMCTSFLWCAHLSSLCVPEFHNVNGYVSLVHAEKIISKVSLKKQVRQQICENTIIQFACSSWTLACIKIHAEIIKTHIYDFLIQCSKQTCSRKTA